MGNSWRAPLLLLALTLVAAAPAPARPGQRPVLLTPQPNSELDSTARTLLAQELAEAGQANEKPLLLVAAARLGGPRERPALFVQLQSARECGSAGCSTAIYRFSQGNWQRVLDAVSGPIHVDNASHGGMRDLIVNDRDRWTWNGRAYVNSRPAPDVDLKPRPARKAHKSG